MKLMLRIIDGSLMIAKAQLVGWDDSLDGLFVDTGDYAFLVPMSKQEAKKHLLDLMTNDVLNLSHLQAVPVLDDDSVQDGDSPADVF